MAQNIKDEFKQFIEILSTQICKEVLLEQLSQLSTSFSEIESNYENLYAQYSYSIKGIQKELEEFRGTNQKLTQFIKYIGENNKKVSQALSYVEEENKSLFKKYSLQIQALNLEERKKFIEALITRLNEHEQEFMKQLKELIPTKQISTLEQRILEVYGKQAQVEGIVNQIKRKIELLEEKVTEQINSKSEKLEEINKQHKFALEEALVVMKRQMNDNVILMGNKVDEVNEQMNSQFIALSTLIRKQNNLIIILEVIIGILCIALFLK